MKKLNKIWSLAPLAVLAVACGKKPSDDSLKNDLALASQAQQYTAQQVTSPAEELDFDQADRLRAVASRENVTSS